MSWVLLTLLAVNFWAFANIIDKYVIGNHIKNPFIYVGIGSLPTLLYTIILVLVFGVTIPSLFYFLIALVPGVLTTIAFLMYAKAIDAEEVSRVIPLYGLGTIFTLLLSTIFLQEIFTLGKYLGIILLVVGSFFISYKYHKSSGRFSKAFLFMAIVSALYAVSWVIVRYLSYSMDSMSIFIISEIGLVVSAFIPFIANIDQIRKIFIKDNKIIYFRLLSGFLGFLGLLVYYKAISEGSAALTTALDLTQAFFVLVYATLISIFIPKILKEEIKGSIITLKILAIALMIIGSYLISV
ncbi:MAG: DMT family transporter [Candidatus Aenigmarchaeota archaeon]|nr:DMT family transporter [Candidatus Aenigmarchaeota archaeon]